jgi:antitoxin (DNA-binding transcriptional repressor) of toxin-antitoxin stability system
MRRALFTLACLGAVACPAPADITPIIHVDPRAAQRLNWLAKLSASAEPAAAAVARVHVMKEGEQLGGPNAVGRPGDFVLENAEVVFVVDQLGSSAGFAESGGNLVDAADAHARKDELGQMFTFFGTFPRQGVYETITTGGDVDGTAWIEAKGKELYEPALVVTTRYTLHGPDRALLVETTVENTGDTLVTLPALGDAVQWGAAEKVAPGKPRGFKGPASGPYLGGVGRFVSYALTSTEGAVESVSGSSWSDTTQRKDVKLGPHGRTAYARVFIVGERADTSSLVGELALAAGKPVGSLRVATSPMATGVKLQLLADGATEAMTLAAPFTGNVPVGKYTVSAPGAAAQAKVDVTAEGEAKATLAVDPPAQLAVRCADERGAAMPCKVTFEGTSGTPDPDFGPAHAAGPAHGQATTADGAVSVSLAPGSYRVTASRGPEYALGSQEVQLAGGDRKSVALTVARVVDTAGYLGCDFHQHTMLGADAPVGKVDRLVSNVAEGVEVAVTSEHNVVADLEPLVREHHLEAQMAAIAGDELTTDASRKPWGHANVWPMVADPNKPRGGAPVVRDRNAHETFEALRQDASALGTDFVLQINHPRTKLTGYFDQLGFDRARGVGTDPTYDARFDALEVWNGRNVEARAAVLEDWRALLRTGHPVTPTADTDTHGIVGQEAGYPRTYVRVSDDGALDAWNAARTADVVHGVKALRDVVLTNGPMLRVSANGAPIGGLAKGRAVTVKVHVECAPWVDVDTVKVVRARDGAPEVSKSVTLAPLKDGARGADVTFAALRFDADDALFVVASGGKTLAPVLPLLGGDPRDVLPWAMTGAIWVDADGDGKSLGR